MARKFVNIEPLPNDDFDYRLAFDGLDHYRNLNPTVCKRFMSVRLYLGGRQRILAVSSIQRAHEAARFADLLVTRFWKYRVRGQTPTDADTNFSLSLAHEDYEFLSINRPDVIKMIDDLENHLIARRALNLMEPGQTEPRPEKRMSALAVLRDVLKTSYEELSGRMDQLNVGLFENVKGLDAQNRKIDANHGETAARLTALERSIRELLIQTKLIIEPVKQNPVPAPVVGQQTELPVEAFKNGIGFSETDGNKAGIITLSPSVFSVGTKKQTGT